MRALDIETEKLREDARHLQAVADGIEPVHNVNIQPEDCGLFGAPFIFFGLSVSEIGEKAVQSFLTEVSNFADGLNLTACDSENTDSGEARNIAQRVDAA